MRSVGLPFFITLFLLLIFPVGGVSGEEAETTQGSDYHFTLQAEEYETLADIHRLFLDYGTENSEAWRTRLESILDTRNLHPDLILAVANAIKTVSGAEAAHKLFERALRQFNKVKLRLGVVPPLAYQYRHAGLLLAVEQTDEALAILSQLSANAETNDCDGVLDALRIGRGSGNREKQHLWIDNYGQSHPDCLRIAERKIADWQGRGRLIGSVRNSALDSPIIRETQQRASMNEATLYDQFLAGITAYAGQRYPLAIETLGNIGTPNPLVRLYLALSHYRADDIEAARKILATDERSTALHPLAIAILLRNTDPGAALEVLKQPLESWLKDPLAVIPYAVATKLEQALKKHRTAIEAKQIHLEDPEFHIHGAPRPGSKIKKVAVEHPSKPVSRTQRSTTQKSNTRPPPGPESTATASRPSPKTLPAPGNGTYALLALLGLLFLGTYRIQRRQS
ncbi:MAG: hypothetical protein CMH54_11160 [Myxococcales bacterium]|nr:hypothetical protein [Myxococcales bacterium]